MEQRVKYALIGAALGAVVLAVAAVAWFYRGENVESHYATAGEARAQGAFERGWLPQVLLPDSSEITEFHDIDTNAGGGTFSYAPEIINRLNAECRTFAATVRMSRPFAGWPDFLHDGDTAEALERNGMKLYCCPRAVFAIDVPHAQGYFWHAGSRANCASD